MFSIQNNFLSKSIFTYMSCSYIISKEGHIDAFDYNKNFIYIRFQCKTSLYQIQYLLACLVVTLQVKRITLLHLIKTKFHLHMI